MPLFPCTHKCSFFLGLWPFFPPQSTPCLSLLSLLAMNGCVSFTSNKAGYGNCLLKFAPKIPCQPPPNPFSAGSIQLLIQGVYVNHLIRKCVFLPIECRAFGCHTSRTVEVHRRLRHQINFSRQMAQSLAIEKFRWKKGRVQIHCLEFQDDWLIGWLVGWLICWLAGWKLVVKLLVYLLVRLPMGWLVVCLVGW